MKAFITYLREVEVLPPDHIELSPAEALCQRYLMHLRSRQGLSAHSIAAYSVSARSFIEAIGLPEQPDRADALAIRGHLLTLSQQHAVATVKLSAAGLRSFLHGQRAQETVYAVAR